MRAALGVWLLALAVLGAAAEPFQASPDAWCSQCIQHLALHDAAQPETLAAAHDGTVAVLNSMCVLSALNRTQQLMRLECDRTFRPFNPTCSSCCRDVIRRPKSFCQIDTITGKYGYKAPKLLLKDGCKGSSTLSPSCVSERAVDPVTNLARKIDRLERRLSGLRNSGEMKALQTDSMDTSKAEYRSVAEARDRLYEVRSKFRSIGAKVRVTKVQLAQLRSQSTDPQQAAVIAAAEAAEAALNSSATNGTSTGTSPVVTASADTPENIAKSIAGIEAEIKATSAVLQRMSASAFRNPVFSREAASLVGKQKSLRKMRKDEHSILKSMQATFVSKRAALGPRGKKSLLSRDARAHVDAFLMARRMFESVDTDMRELSELVGKHSHLVHAVAALTGAATMTDVAVQSPAMRVAVEESRKVSSKIYILASRLGKFASGIESSAAIKGFLTQGNEVNELRTQSHELAAVQTLVQDQIKFLEERVVGAAASCTSLLASGNALDDLEHPGSNGLYVVQPTLGLSTKAYCDMSTDGGGWMLTMAYHHLPNGPKTAIKGWTLPPDPEVTRPSDGSHLELAEIGVAAADVAEVRFRCSSAAHERILHFKTDNYNVRKMVVHGRASTSAADWTQSSEPLAGHTAFLPEGVKFSGIEGGADPDLFNAPFWSEKAMWNMGGQAGSWMCDEVAGKEDHATLHTVWVRSEFDANKVGNISAVEVDTRMTEFKDALEKLEDAFDSAGKNVLAIAGEVMSLDFAGLTQTELKGIIDWAQATMDEPNGGSTQIIDAASKQLAEVNASDTVHARSRAQLSNGPQEAAEQVRELKANISSFTAILSEKDIEARQLEQDRQAAGGDRETIEAVDAEASVVRKERAQLSGHIGELKAELAEASQRAESMQRLQSTTVGAVRQMK